MKVCGICGKEATVGPFAGGPFSWYCSNCHAVIRKFLQAAKEHKEWFAEQRRLLEATK